MPAATTRARRTHVFLAAGAVAGAGVLSACSIVFGFDGFTGSENDGGSSGGGTSGGGSGTSGGGTSGGGTSGSPPVVTPCGAGVCLPPAPQGWSGPTILWRGGASAEPPACPDGQLPPIKGVSGLNAGAATCTACGCSLGPPSCDVMIDGADIVFGCNGNTTPVTSTCGPFSTGFGGNRGAIPMPQPKAACTATGGTATVPPASWTGTGEICNAVPLDGASCPSGETCHQSPPAGFVAGQYCIYASGDNDCPRDVYTELADVSDGKLVDDRGCSPCACGAVGGTCGANGARVDIFSDTGCATLLASFAIPTSCSTFPDAGTALTPRSVRLNGAPAVGTAPTCSSFGGTPRGSARPSSFTVCCTP
jgi:hypothetical protein